MRVLVFVLVIDPDWEDIALISKQNSLKNNQTQHIPNFDYDYAHRSAEHAHDFRLFGYPLTSRHELKSVIITSNLGFGEWTHVFGDVSLTGALLDRLTHKAEIISCLWDSYRLKESLKHKMKEKPGW